MKYLRYIFIVLFKLFSKVFGLAWYWVALPFRGYARNRVYNYVLQNNIYLPRLLEREPRLIYDNLIYTLKDIHSVQKNNEKDIEGIIVYKKVSKIEYYLVLWLLWIWLDDDSNHDTMSGGYIPGKVYGNTFDLGDVRAAYPEFEFVKSYKWLIRNTAYNFNYMFEEIREDNPNNFYLRFKDWHFGYIPYRNSVRKGRLVFFSEDIKYIDKEIK